MKKIILLLIFAIQFVQAQSIKEVVPPSYIRSVSFNQNAESLMPFFRLGSTFNLEFDDLTAEESDYYYQVQHCDRNWQPSNIAKAEYLYGIDDIRISQVKNSINTLQPYSHYRLTFPNSNSRLLLSGNYVISILNSDREVVFSRRLVLYEEQVSIGVEGKRLRDLDKQREKQRVEVSYDFGQQNFVNPKENFHLVLFQNGRFDNRIENIKPQFTLGTTFQYQWEELQFWGGNEYLFFDNSDIRQTNNNVAQITSQGGIFNIHLFPFVPRDYYTYFQDVNGVFYPRNQMREDWSIESDYAWVYFSLKADEEIQSPVYVVGMFNNYNISEENYMQYNPTKKVYEVAILLKQGFTNYRFVRVKNHKIDDQNAIDGNFFETENNYKALLYYRGNVDRYDRIVGFGETNSINITN